MTKHLFKFDSYAKKFQFFSLGFTVPIIIMMIFVNFFVSVPLQKVFITQHDRQINAEVRNIDRQLSQSETLLSNWGYSFEPQYSINKFGPKIDATEMNQIASTLSVIASSNPLITNCQLIYSGSDAFILSPSGTFQLFDKSLFSKYRITNNNKFQWRRVDNNTIILLDNLSDTVDKQHHLYAVLTIDSQMLLELLSDTDNGNIKNQVTIDDVSITKSGSFRFSNNSNKKSWTQRNHETTYSVVRSSFKRLTQKWSFYSAIPIDNITGQIKFFTNILLLLELLLLVLTFLLGRIYARNQYKPIKRTLDQLFGNKDWSHINEFEYLSNKWQQMVHQQTNLQKAADQVVLYSKHMIIRQIIEGYYRYLSEADLSKLIIDNGWHHYHGNYQLMAIQVHTPPITMAPKYERSEFTLFAFQNIINDILDQEFSEFAIIDSTNNTLLLFIDSKNRTALQRVAESAITNINKILEYKVTIAYSNVECSLVTLPTLQHQLLRRLRYRKIIRDNEIIEFNHTKPDISYTYPIAIESAMITAFKTNDPSELLNNTTQFVNTIVNQNSHQIVLINAISRLYDNIDYFVKGIRLNPNTYISKDILTNIVTGLLSSTTISQYIYQSFLLPIFTGYQAELLKHNQGTINQVISYINNNYLDPNLSLDSVANNFNMDSFALSKSFKHSIKQSFTDYVTDLRIAEAKRLLSESDKSINDIADLLGYSGSYFNRLFKKKVGTTPGQFRTTNFKK